MDAHTETILRQELSHHISRAFEINRMLNGGAAPEPHSTVIMEKDRESGLPKFFRGNASRAVSDAKQKELFDLYGRMNWREAQDAANVRPGQAWFNFHLWRMGDREPEIIKTIAELKAGGESSLRMISFELKRAFGGNRSFYEIYARDIWNLLP